MRRKKLQWIAPLAVLAAIALLAAGFAALFTSQAYGGDLSGGLLLAVALLSALAGSQLAVSLVNLVATVLTTPRRLPRMDFSKGIPAEYRTLVVVPIPLKSGLEIPREWIFWWASSTAF